MDKMDKAAIAGLLTYLLLYVFADIMEIICRWIFL